MAYYAVSAPAIRRNIEKITRQADGRAVWAVLKCDAYGLGLLPMAAVCRSAGITRFCVTEPDDALALRENASAQEEVLLLRPITDADTLRALLRRNVICTVASQQDAIALASAASAEALRARAHIAIDTGMGRYGFLPDQIDEILTCYQHLEHIDFCGMYTHFARAATDTRFARLQTERLLLVRDAVRNAGFEVGHLHAGNSSALFRCVDCAQDGVRVGSALLGRTMFRTKLERIGVAKAELTELRWLPKGATFGYDSAYVAPHPVRIAILPVGWFHGFSMTNDVDTFRFRDRLGRLLHSLKGFFFPRRLTVTVGGQKCPVLGRVGMCHTVIDVTKAAVSGGEEAELAINPTRLHALPIRWEED